MSRILLRVTPCLVAFSLLAPHTSALQQADSNSGQSNPSDPQPDANGIYHTGNGIPIPQCIHKALPETTDAARKRKTSGKAIVEIVVEPDGTVGSARILKSVADAYKNKEDHDAALTLDSKAVEAARQYRFEPTTVKGKPVALELKLEIAFQFT